MKYYSFYEKITFTYNSLHGHILANFRGFFLQLPHFSEQTTKVASIFFYS